MVPRNNRTLLFLSLSLLFVGLIVWGFYKLVYKPEEIDQSVVDGGQLITDPYLRRLSNWRNYHLIGYRLEKQNSDQYQLIIHFNWNRVQESLLSYREEKKQEKIKNIKQAQTIFDNIVDALDNTTKGNEILDWKQDPLMERVSNNTLDLFEINELAEIERAAKQEGPVMTPEELDSLFYYLDLINLDLELKQLLGLKLNNRLMEIKVPLKVVQNNTDSTLLLFDPPKSNKDKSMVNKLKAVHFLISQNQLIINPVDSKPEERMIINLINKQSF